jgi:polysaccharide deacetylase 2 family uncharacterized protein YibQ
MLNRYGKALALVCLLSNWPATGTAGDDADHAVIGIIIDDLGYRLQEGRRALALPGSVSYAVLPHTPFARQFSTAISDSGRDLLIHIPMEAENPAPALGPGALRSSMSEDQYIHTLTASILSLPKAMGVNNHMGSLLTQREPQMRWLMETLQCHGRMVFVDSRTTPKTVAAQQAHLHHVPTVSRDVFLDNSRDEAQIQVQFQHLLDKARQQGAAIAIGHPYNSTLDVLERMLPRLHHHNVRLVGVSDLLDRQDRPEVKLPTLVSK